MTETSFGLEGLRRLHELVVDIHSLDGLDETLHAVADGVRSLVGFEIAVVNLAQPDGRLECVTVVGNDQARELLMGQRLPMADIEAELEAGERWGSLVFIPHGSTLIDADHVSWTTDEQPIDAPDAWHPEDLLYAPLRSRTGDLLGTLGVDLPDDRMRPGPVRRQLLEMFARHAEIAIDSARSQQLVRNSEATMRFAFEGAGNPMAIVSLAPGEEGRLLRVNSAFSRLLDRDESELIGTDVHELIHPEDRATHTVDIDCLRSRQQAGYVRERRYLHAAGHHVWVEVMATLIDEARGQQPYVVALLHDIRERRRVSAELERRAHQDDLTELPNRRALQSRLRTALDQASSTRSPGAVFFCDLDGFKAVNDTHGHAAGDQVLLAVAGRLARLVRAQDGVFRIGGDEFVIVTDEMTPSRVLEMTQRIAVAVSAPILLGDVTVEVSCSVGAATVPVDDGDVDGVLAEADQAMYAVKTTG